MRETPRIIGSVSASQVEAALGDLTDEAVRVRASVWPGGLQRLDNPGLYSWWVDKDGAALLSQALPESIGPGLIYAGQAGATAWPSGKRSDATLASRVGGNHVGGRARSSTFRLTLASLLIQPLKLVPTAPRTLSPESESVLSQWIAQHLEVAIHLFPDADALAELEDRLLDTLDPPLNLKGRPMTAVRTRLAELRRAVSSERNSATGPTQKKASKPRRDARVAAPSRSAQITLHEEIAAILNEQGGWMTTQQIADAVNQRGRYSKRDGSEVTAFQIHGRTRKYEQLFERDGSRVRLRLALSDTLPAP